MVAAFAAQPGAGVVGIDGVMYDRPHLVRAAQAACSRAPRIARAVNYVFSPYTASGSNVFSPSRNSSVTAPAVPSGTAR